MAGRIHRAVWGKSGSREQFSIRVQAVRRVSRPYTVAGINRTANLRQIAKSIAIVMLLVPIMTVVYPRKEERELQGREAIRSYLPIEGRSDRIALERLVIEQVGLKTDKMESATLACPGTITLQPYKGFPYRTRLHSTYPTCLHGMMVHLAGSD